MQAKTESLKATVNQMKLSGIRIFIVIEAMHKINARRNFLLNERSMCEHGWIILLQENPSILFVDLLTRVDDC